MTKKAIIQIRRPLSTSEMASIRDLANRMFDDETRAVIFNGPIHIEFVDIDNEWVCDFCRHKNIGGGDCDSCGAPRLWIGKADEIQRMTSLTEQDKEDIRGIGGDVFYGK